MKLLIVTGAGASRELGKDKELPLMSDWATLLCAELDRREPRLAEAIGLMPAMASDEFERTLGALTTWMRARSLAPRFFGLTGGHAGDVPNSVPAVFSREEDRLKGIIEGLRTSLYREFGTDRIDQGIAAASYEELLRALGEPDRLAIATTNYDPSAELALEILDKKPRTGFNRPPARTPELAPAGLVKSSLEENNVPVLHLHGAVGWYERGGKVLEYAPDQAYNPTHGTPAVLYPDPDKDPTQDAAVQALWIEFQEAMAAADRILVFGHSLNDPVLVDALRTSASRRRLAIAVDTELPLEERTLVGDRFEALLPEAEIVEMHFGPNLDVSQELREWLAGAPAPSL
jgi:hypothetical protein